MSLKYLRTPDERFENLSDYDFEPHYHTVIEDDGAELRMHYLDEGPENGPVVLLLHGEPTWSYLYRHMIPPLAAAGFRVLAPDLIGFGRSDKPLARSDFSYERHLSWLAHWFDALAIRDVTLFCQDWGGLLGLRIVAAQPDRFARVVVANTVLPAGRDPGKGFLAWLHFSQDRPCMECGKVVQGGSQRTLSEAEVAAYDAPFPDERYKAGPHVFPTLVPIRPDQPSVTENLAAWESLARFEKPLLTVFGDQDPVLGQADKVFHAKVPGAAGQPHQRIATAGHFIQEDASAELARIIIDFARE